MDNIWSRTESPLRRSDARRSPGALRITAFLLMKGIRPPSTWLSSPQQNHYSPDYGKSIISFMTLTNIYVLVLNTQTTERRMTRDVIYAYGVNTFVRKLIKGCHFILNRFLSLPAAMLQIGRSLVRSHLVSVDFSLT